jgi:predicted phage tail protein
VLSEVLRPLKVAVEAFEAWMNSNLYKLSFLPFSNHTEYVQDEPLRTGQEEVAFEVQETCTPA